jgi:hypothetical protein
VLRSGKRSLERRIKGKKRERDWIYKNEVEVFYGIY